MAIDCEEKLQKFITNHIDLVAEYESLGSAIPLEYCSNDIIYLFNNLLKINRSIDFNSTMDSALKYAIRYNIPVTDSLETILAGSTIDQTATNSIQQYFKEINDIYNRNSNNYDIEYNEMNREKLIEMNLKTVISVAKKYQGLGLSLGELISAGNLGLVVAYDKFDPSRSKLKDNMMDAVNELPEDFTYNELNEAIKNFLTYGDIKKKFNDHFQQSNTYTKKEVVKWINSNIYNAKFNSIATMWIRAYILIEIDNNSRVVKKPKAEIYRDREKYGAYKKEITLDIDAPISDDSDTVVSDIFQVEDDSRSDLEVSEAYDTFKAGLNLLLDGVKTRDRSIFLKKFGIGLPRPMLPKEIAEQEGLSIARISQIFQTVIEQMQRNQVRYGVDQDILFDAVRKIY